MPGNQAVGPQFDYLFLPGTLLAFKMQVQPPVARKNLQGEGIVGGSSRLSGGLMMGAGTRYQKALGIEDSPEALFHDYMTLNQWKVESAVVERLTQRAGAAVEWLGVIGMLVVSLVGIFLVWQGFLWALTQWSPP